MTWFCLAACYTAQAEVYEWIDEAGQRHFSDQKPNDVDPSIIEPFQLHDDTPQPQQTKEAYQAKRYASPPRKPSRSRQRRQRQAKARLKQQQRCEKYLDQMRKIQTQLRRGYREPQGNRLRQRRFELSKKYQKECR